MNEYFNALQKIVDSCSVVIDRTKGSAHPKYPDYIYPLDYGYLDGAKSQDGGGIDVWCGTGDRSDISGILVIADPVKKDSEIKVLLGCDKAEIELATECSNRGDMKAMLIKKESIK